MRPSAGQASSSSAMQPNTSAVGQAGLDHLLRNTSLSNASPSLPSSTPSSAIASTSSSVAATAAPGSSQEASKENPPLLPTPEQKTWAYFRKTIAPWTPHRLSNREVNEIRIDSERRRRNISYLETLLKPNGQSDPQLVARIRWERFDRAIRFFRIFRINDLPAEIMNNILRFVIWSADSPRSGIVWRLHMTWVCRHWRHLAITDSTLWNAIWFRDPPPYERSFAFLDRAGVAPLDLRISDSETNKLKDEQMQLILDKVFTKISSIRMLIVLCYEWEPVLSVLNKLSDAGEAGVPIHMERFELHRVGNPYIWPGPKYEPQGHKRTLFPLFGGAIAPSLSYFSINGVHIDWDRSFLKNLTTFDIRRIPLELAPDLERFRTILRESPRLEKLSLDGAGPSGPPDHNHELEPITLLNLHTLVLANFTVPYALAACSHISAPNLRDLTMMNFFGNDYTPLYAQITSKFPKVRLLTLYGIACVATEASVATMVRWLDSMPLLSYLRLATVRNDLLRCFILDPDTMAPHSLLANPGPKGLVSPLAFVPEVPKSKREFMQAAGGRIICPNISVVECQSMEAKHLILWAQARAVINAPLFRIYLSGDLAKPEVAEEIKGKLKHNERITFLTVGGRTEEEDILMKLK